MNDQIKGGDQLQISWMRLPFRYRSEQDFEDRLMELISKAFYEKLPAAGFEVREEQIYTAYRIARATSRGEVFLAEAGTGTGKTFAYLIPAVCHARRQGKPVVIACATGVLQSQLAGPGGDVATLSGLLELDIDARLAQEPRNYVCEVKLDGLTRSGIRKKGLTRLLRWAEASKRGERSEIPDVPDELWEDAAWDETLHCDTCKRRGYCRMIRARDHYRAATDLIICSHDLFFRDLWSREERQDAGLRPLLPPYSGVIFDEGHRVPDAARDTAGRSLSREVLERTLVQIEHSVLYRLKLGEAVLEVEPALARLWVELAAAALPSQTERWHVQRTPGLLEAARILADTLALIQEELVLEEDTVDTTAQVVWHVTMQARLETASESLDLLLAPADEIALWASAPGTPEAVLWAVPRRIDQRLQQELFRHRIPVVLTSATLAGDGSFNYIKRMIGVPQAGHARAGTPFDYASQALVYMPERAADDPVAHLVDLLRTTNGRALVLVNTVAELTALREALSRFDMPWPLLWEGDADRGALLQRFRSDIPSVLVGLSFWEGIDVPGESLSCVAVLKLPFPPDDPLLRVRQEEARRHGLDPFTAVDVPEMALKLKQGCGRLIRTASDRGVFAVLDVSHRGAPYAPAVESAFPDEAPTASTLDEIAVFLRPGK